MNKTYTFINSNGTFISFLDYEREDDFAIFLKFVCEKLMIPVPEIQFSPYSLYAEVEFEGAGLTITASHDMGCYIRIPPECELSGEKLISKIYNTTC